MVLWHKAQNLMRDEGLPPDVRQALIDRFDGYEIVELLDLDAETVIDAIEDKLEEKLPAVREALGMEPEEDDENGRD